MAVCIENNYITFYLDEISQLGFKGNNPFDTAKYRNHGIFLNIMNPAATRPPPEAMTFLTSTQKNNNFRKNLLHRIFFTSVNTV
jgi:hypothetical protein